MATGESERTFGRALAVVEVVASAAGGGYRLQGIPSGVVVDCGASVGVDRVEHFLHFSGASSFLAWATLEAQEVGDPELVEKLWAGFCDVTAGGGPLDLDESSVPDLDYASRVMGIVQGIEAARDQAETLDLMHRARRVLGADASLYVSVIPETRGRRSIRVLREGDVTGFDGSRLIGGGIDARWLSSAASRSEPYVVSRPFSEALGPVPAQMDPFQTTLVVPTPSAPGLRRFGVMCFGSASEGLFEAEQDGLARLLARILAAEVNGWWFHASGAALIRDATLDAVDLAVLALMREGAGTGAMAQALDLSGEAVSRRLRSVVVRLGRSSRRAALQRAVDYGLV